MNKKNRLVFLGVVAVVFAVLAFIVIRINFYTPEISYQKVVRAIDVDEITIAALVLRPEYRYPSGDQNTPTRAINTQVFEGLVGLSKDFKIMPLLAERWVNPSDTVWRFYLREGVKFHNGKEFTAADVKFSLEAIDEKGFYGKAMLADVKEISIIDDYTITIETSRPDPLLVNKLSQVWIFNEDYLDEQGNILSIGTGPYKLEEWQEEGEYVILTRNEDYWGERAKIERVTWRDFLRDADRFGAVEEGEADIAYLIEGPDGISLALESGRVETVLVSDFYPNLLKFDIMRDETPYVFGTEENPFKDIRVRKAIYQAIDIDRLIDMALDGFGEPQSQIVTRDIFGFNPEIERYPYDPERARELLVEAGYPDGFEVEYRTTFYYEHIAEAIAEILSEIGIEVSVVLADDEPQGLIDWHNGDVSLFDIQAAPQFGDATRPLLDNFHTPDHDEYTMRTLGMYNVGKYSNPELDALIDKANREINPKERLVFLQEAIKLIHEEVVCVPLFTVQIGFALNPRANLLFEARPDMEVRAYELAGRKIDYELVEERKDFWSIIFGL